MYFTELITIHMLMLIVSTFYIIKYKPRKMFLGPSPVIYNRDREMENAKDVAIQTAIGIIILYIYLQLRGNQMDWNELVYTYGFIFLLSQVVNVLYLFITSCLTPSKEN